MGLGGSVPLITIPSNSKLKMMEVTPIMDETIPCHLWIGMTARFSVVIITFPRQSQSIVCLDKQQLVYCRPGRKSVIVITM